MLFSKSIGPAKKKTYRTAVQSLGLWATRKTTTLQGSTCVISATSFAKKMGEEKQKKEGKLGRKRFSPPSFFPSLAFSHKHGPEITLDRGSPSIFAFRLPTPSWVETRIRLKLLLMEVSSRNFEEIIFIVMREIRYICTELQSFKVYQN